MAIGVARPTILALKIILVRPRAKLRWEVIMDGLERSHLFADRRLAVNYAKLWAGANSPSAVRVLNSAGGLAREWNFR